MTAGLPDKQITYGNRAALIAEAIQRILGASGVAALATAVEAPLTAGAKLLVSETGARAGTLGHPELDNIIAAHAPEFLASNSDVRIVRVEELVPAGSEIQPVELAHARVLLERIEPEARIIICGAGHVGAALARLARAVNYRTTLIDDRPEFVSRLRFPDEAIELVTARRWTEAIHNALGAGRGVSVVIVTRGHNEDEECLRAAIEHRPDYLGLIGSRRRTNIVLDRLRAGGVDGHILDEVRAPVGLDIGAITPEEVALAILAEIVAERRGGTGAPLSAWRRQG